MPINPISPSNASQQINTSQQRISSGQRINSAKDDAAGLAISTRFSAQERGLNVAIRNSVDGISLFQTEGGALNSVKEDLQRIRELGVQAGNGILNESDRAALKLEADQLRENISNTLDTANFNGKALFENRNEVFQVGDKAGETIEFKTEDIREGLESNGFSFESNEDPFDLDTLDAALAVVTERETEIGAIQNRLERTVDAQKQKAISAAEAYSRIADADIAKETSNQVSADIRNRASIAVQAQSNARESDVLRLLG